MKFKLAIFLIVLFSVSCQTEKEQNLALVSGKINGTHGGQVRLEELKTGRLIPQDSAKINAKGNFQLKAFPKEAGFYMLRFSNDHTVSLVLNKQDTLILNADTAPGFLDYQISGNAGSRMLELYHHKTGATLSGIDSLREVLFLKQDNQDFARIKPSIDSTLKDVLQQHRTYAEQLIRDNPAELASILLINKAIAGQPLFTTEENADLYFLIEDPLLARYPSNSHVNAHARRMDRLRQKMDAQAKAEARVGVGKEIPQLKLKDIDGRQQSLQQFRGKNIILFFWASWSPESRADIQLMKSAYQNWKSKHLKIYAVSLDHKEQFWKAAVETENLQWVNVSDLAGPQGPIARLFNIPDALPFYYLIDTSGLINAKTGDFSELKNAVDTLLKTNS